jgi:hypothetical protein
MGIQETITPIHWNYFLALEEDVAHLARYLEFTSANFDAYSIELARMLFAAASEIDVVAKQYCKKMDNESKAKNIAHYKTEITAKHPAFHSIRVLMPRYGLTLEPWVNWGGAKQPLWWRAYNDVKHERHAYFRDANLKNALNAVAALYVLLLFFYREEAQVGRLGPNPRLFRAGEPFVVDTLMWGHERTFVYGFEQLG